MLTDAAIRKAKPGPKPVKLFDRDGLFLIVSPNGSKWWRFRYRVLGTSSEEADRGREWREKSGLPTKTARPKAKREKTISLGRYPDVSLARARALCAEARTRVAAGHDPSEDRKAEKLSAFDTFRAIAEEWFDKHRERLAPITIKKNRERLAKHVFPHIGSMRVRDIDAPTLLRMLHRIEEKGRNETAHKLLRICGQIIRHAVNTKRADRDVTWKLAETLKPVIVEHRAAVTDPKKVGALLRMLETYDGTAVVAAALRLAPLVFVRPGELRQAEWSEIDLDRAEWTIPAFKMKMRNSLTVPLSTQAIAILREIQPITGSGKYVFPSGRGGDRPMSDAAILAAMRRIGIAKDEMTGHGWRAVARTLLDEVHEVRVDLIEAQLGHAVIDRNGRAYNRTTFLAERRKMMQQWADYLDTLRNQRDAAKEA